MSIAIRHRSRACTAILAAVLCMIPCATRAASVACVPLGAWATLGASGPAPVASSDFLARLARQAVVLLGELHDSSEDHRWQLQTLTSLHALRPDMALAFEMFPRRLQPALDRWVAGEYTVPEFLKVVDWNRVWNFDPQLYLPIFHFARMNRIPMVAMNVELTLVRAVGAKGFDDVPADTREGVTKPAVPSAAYVDYLVPVYRAHPQEGTAQDDKTFDRNNAAVRRFIESQQLWDRALAQAIAGAASQQGAPLVVGILGKGHITQGFGVPHQLADLGVKNVSWLVTWQPDGDCGQLTTGYADAVFGVAPAAQTEVAAERPLLGVQIETRDGALHILEVVKGSIAEAAGILKGDVISEAAGVALKEFMDLRTIVQRQSAGTWLPLKVKRQDDTLDIVAKFPSAKP